MLEKQNRRNAITNKLDFLKEKVPAEFSYHGAVEISLSKDKNFIFCRSQKEGDDKHGSW